MAKDKEKKEDTEEEKKAIKRAYALEGLKSEYISNLASAGFSQLEEGQIPKYGLIFSGLYESTVEKTPDQKAYDRLFKDALLSDEGSISKSSLKLRARNVILQALPDVQVSDIFELIGSKKGLKADYANKFVYELDDKEKELIAGSYVTSMVNKKAEALLAKERASIVGGLEKKFCMAEAA